MLRRLLEHPLTRGRDLDEPSATGLHRRILGEKELLRGIYRDWYAAIARALPAVPGAVVELGSGAGFIDEQLPETLRSDVCWLPDLDLALDAGALPFADGAVRAIVMSSVLHHLPDPSAFFDEAARTIRCGGRLVIIEPWATIWSRWVYRHLHHEPFLPAASWRHGGCGRLSGANIAIPWIVFVRDRDELARRHPQWRLLGIEPMMPLRYLVSGGLSIRRLVPDWTEPLWRGIEAALHPLRGAVGMFAEIVLERR